MRKVKKVSVTHYSLLVLVCFPGKGSFFTTRYLSFCFFQAQSKFLHHQIQPSYSIASSWDLGAFICREIGGCHSHLPCLMIVKILDFCSLLVSDLDNNLKETQDFYIERCESDMKQTSNLSSESSPAVRDWFTSQQTSKSLHLKVFSHAPKRSRAEKLTNSSPSQKD